ncbi:MULTISPECIES: hypothetical protein [Sinorhizobium]|uniref:hypothetical protein n=1 Tax=Sinorhizobium TaxID=28105 RepID=UPI000FD4131A|nr:MULTISPECIES: hypothetical protein [Sinorhizobium]MBO1962349.1 hypothetical protein [Sinorhizobium medicae]MCM5692451.1 hypothetical protein [Sinorhizobium meliloti]MDE3784941.1 hypothetical protein [Sinorhizobium meliloti]RVI01611.1 hypothetical protein CN206_29040 [Sinorhizobium meliloti]RVL60394.1 hypothetical protein CN141_12890 [Sinorhizobium meliloti]
MAEPVALKPYIASSNDALHSYGGGDPPGGDNLEARITALEGIAADTRSTLESIQRQLARIDSKLDAKPDQGWVITVIIAVYGLSFAAIAATAAMFALIK